MAGLLQGIQTPKLSQRVTELSDKDSPLMKQAKSAGLKSAAARGLLNSTMAGKAAQSAALGVVLPIAQQEVQQEFQAGQADLDRGLSREQLASQQEFQRGESALDRGLSRETRDADFAFRGTQADLDRGLSREQLASQQAFQRGESALDRGLSREQFDRDISFRGTQADLDRGLTRETRDADIAFRGSQAALDRGLTRENRDADFAFRGSQAALDRGLTREQQAADQAFRSTEARLDRETQERINNLNLSAADREAASRVLISFDQLYQSQYDNIMANTNLSAEDRTKFLQDAKDLRDKRLNLFEQMYAVDITW